MADRLKTNRIIRLLHRYSAFIITGSLLMYVITGFLMTRHKMWNPQEEKTVTTTHQLEIPSGIKDDDLPLYLQDTFNLKGHRGKIQVNNKKEITILYSRPGIRHQVVISPDRKSLNLKSTRTNLRSTITAFHRLKGYGGGLIYDMYVMITDLTACSIILFAFTGLYLGFSNGRSLIPKLIVFLVGIGYTLLVIYSFLKA